MRIIVVDDDSASRAIITNKLMLENDQDQIFERSNGEEVLNLIQTQPVDLVITDLIMPGISGLELLKALKSLDPNIEVIVVTGHASVQTAVEAMQKGARDYIEKPVNIMLLKEKVDNVRDYVHKIRQVEEYRKSKEKLEANISLMIYDLEDNLISSHKALKAIQSTMDSKLSTKEKLEQITAHLKAFSESQSVRGKKTK